MIFFVVLILLPCHYFILMQRLMSTTNVLHFPRSCVICFWFIQTATPTPQFNSYLTSLSSLIYPWLFTNLFFVFLATCPICMHAWTTVLASLVLSCTSSFFNTVYRREVLLWLFILLCSTANIYWFLLLCSISLISLLLLFLSIFF